MSDEPLQEFPDYDSAPASAPPKRKRPSGGERTSAARTKRWRKRHPDAYRNYMRAYMRRRNQLAREEIAAQDAGTYDWPMPEIGPII